MLDSAFESPEVKLEKFREHLRQMSDEELIRLGQLLRRIPRRVSGVPDAFDKLKEARDEWRRRHPALRKKPQVTELG